MASGKPENQQSAGTVEVKTTSGKIVKSSDLERFHSLMRERASLASEDRGAEVMERQALLILAAAQDGNVSDIERADMGGTIQGRDVGGLEIEIHDMEPVISARDDIETREGYYLTMNCVVLGYSGEDDTLLTRMGLEIGQDFILQTGAILFMLKVAAMEMSGQLPYRGRITSIKTRSGNSVLKLYPLPQRVK